MRIGSCDLVEKYGTRLEVVRAWLRGELSSVDERYLDDIFATCGLSAQAMILAAKNAEYDPVVPDDRGRLPGVPRRRLSLDS